MEGQSFFAGLLKGFGTGILDTERQRQTQHLDGQKQLLDLFLKGIQDEQLDPQLGYTHVAGILQDYLTGGTKNSKNALAALVDPENFGQFGAAVHTTLGGQKVRTGKVGPTGLPGVGPVPMGGTNPPEMRPQSVPSEAQEAAPVPETTPLSPEEEQQFQGWVETNQITDLDHPDSHYDYRGYWKATGGAPHQPGDHYPDTFKQHGHPTFSVESQYSRGPDDGGQWAGDRFMPPLQSLAGRSTTVGPPARLWNTPAEQQRRQLESEVGKQQAQTLGQARGQVMAAREFLQSGAASTWPEALEMAKLGRSTAAAQEINARTLYETALEEFRTANGGRDPSPQQKAVMLRQALKEEAEATRTPQASPAVSYQSKAVLLDGKPALVGFNPQTNTYHQGAEDVTARVKDVPPQGVDPLLQQLRQMQLDAARQAAASGGNRTPQQLATFQRIVDGYERSPLIRAADRTIVLKDAVKAAKADPTNATNQLNLAYAYIAALDTYQSAVREGELQNLGLLGTRLQQLGVTVNRLAESGAFIPPAVASQMATSASQLVTTIEAGRTQKTREFSSRAKVSGVGEMWDQFVAGFETPATPPPTGRFNPVTGTVEQPVQPQTPTTPDAEPPTVPTTPPATGAQGTVRGVTRDANGNWVVTPAR